MIGYGLDTVLGYIDYHILVFTERQFERLMTLYFQLSCQFGSPVRFYTN